MNLTGHPGTPYVKVFLWQPPASWGRVRGRVFQAPSAWLDPGEVYTRTEPKGPSPQAQGQSWQERGGCTPVGTIGAVSTKWMFLVKPVPCSTQLVGASFLLPGYTRGCRAARADMFLGRGTTFSFIWKLSLTMEQNLFPPLNLEEPSKS